MTFGKDRCRVSRDGELHLEGRITTTHPTGLYSMQLPQAWVGPGWEEDQGSPPAVFGPGVPMETAHWRLIQTAPSTLKDMPRHGSVIPAYRRLRPILVLK